MKVDFVIMDGIIMDINQDLKAYILST